MILKMSGSITCTTAVVVVVVLCVISSVVCDTLNLPHEEDNNIIGSEKYERIAVPLQCQCGKSNTDKKIVGGTVAKDHAWPWMTAIVTNYNDESPMTICGGSLISNRHILTAAHCLKPIISSGYDNFRIYLGDNKINYGNASTQRIFEIHSVKSHPRYNSQTGDYDAAIIKLRIAVKFNSNILPVCLGQRGNPFINRRAVVAGWGTTMFAGQGVNQLRQTTVTIIGNKNCSNTYMESEKPVTRNMLCAFYPDTGSCQGDSGGPLFLPQSSTVNIYKQVGIVSYGIGCADNKYPEVYVRVQRILSWIKAVTRDGRYCKNSFS